MRTFFLERLRVIFKSIGKLELKVIDKLVLINNSKNKGSTIKDSHFIELEEKLNKSQNIPKKLVIVICFFFNPKKISIFEKTLMNLSLYKFKKEIIILTNNLDDLQRKKIKNIIRKKIRNYSIEEIEDLPENNLLPWYSLNIMRKKIKDKKNSHFMFIEDDIIVNTSNIKYWIYFRKILKKYNLIPGFVRYEIFKKRKISVDNREKINLKNLPTISTKTKENGFVNSKYPYHAMYLMDREMMEEYLLSNSTSLDFSFSNKFMKSNYPIKELANISYAYLNIPQGYHNKLMIPYDKNKKILSCCQILHNENKYTNFVRMKKIGFGTIYLDNFFKKF